jgi:hypothetical protein
MWKVPREHIYRTLEITKCLIRSFRGGDVTDFQNTSIIDKICADPTAWGTSWFKGGFQTYRIQKFVLGFSGQDSILLTEGSILGPCYE